jgi:hypothetical protein
MTSASFVFIASQKRLAVALFLSDSAADIMFCLRTSGVRDQTREAAGL